MCGPEHGVALAWPGPLGVRILALDETSLARLGAEYALAVAANRRGFRAEPRADSWRAGALLRPVEVGGKASTRQRRAQALHAKACKALMKLPWVNDGPRLRRRVDADATRDALLEAVRAGPPSGGSAVAEACADLDDASRRRHFAGEAHRSALAGVRRHLQGPARTRAQAGVAFVREAAVESAQLPALVDWVDREEPTWWAGNSKRARFAGSLPFSGTVQRFEQAFHKPGLGPFALRIATSLGVEDVPSKVFLWLTEARYALATGEVALLEEAHQATLDLGDWAEVHFVRDWREGVSLNTLKQARYQARDELAWTKGPVWAWVYEVLEATEEAIPAPEDEPAE